MLTVNTPDLMRLPDIQTTAQGAAAQAQLVTANNVQYVLTSCGFSLRLNMMTGVMEIQHTSLTDASPRAQGMMEMLILDMCTRVRMKSRETVRELLAILAQEKPYHPMEEWLHGLKWDGVDRIGTLAATITTDEPLWETYLENWLVQVVEGVCGWHGKAKASLPHVLVLVGGQGTGKSHWLKTLGGAYFKGEAELHLSTAGGKDHQIVALKYAIVELAELDGIFRKSDISHMKAFISREEDTIRAPYERRALIRPRLTSFCGSVNDAEFLNDPTGSRRFWPVQVDSIAWDFEMDWVQLWAQAHAFWAENPAFNLTAEEDAQRAARALDAHTIESDESETVREFLRLHMRNKTYPEVAMSTLDVLRMLYGKQRTFNNKQKADTARVLCDIIGRKRTLDGKQRAWMVPFNDFATDRAFWPDKISLL